MNSLASDTCLEQDSFVFSPVEEKVETGIQQLASQYVEAHEHAEQQPALTAQQDEIITEDEPEIVAEQKPIEMEPASKKHS